MPYLLWQGKISYWHMAAGKALRQSGQGKICISSLKICISSLEMHIFKLDYQPYYDYRRTGYPVLPVNPETSQNFNAPDKLPMRWQYPDVEISYNTENVETAIQRQYGSDEVNGVMWILQ